MADRLVQQRGRIARRAFGGAGDQGQCILGNLCVFASSDAFEHANHVFGLDPAQIEALATGQNCYGNFANLSGGKDEFDVRGRLFQRLQQGVEGRGGEHVHFVDDINLVACGGGTVMYALDDFANVANTCARCSVHFHDIDMTPFHDRHTVFAHTARFCRRAASAVGANAVDAFGDDPCSGRFARAANTRHHKRLRDTVCFKRVLERAHHRFLADKIGKGFRAIFSCEDAVGCVWLVGHCGFPDSCAW